MPCTTTGDVDGTTRAFELSELEGLAARTLGSLGEPRRPLLLHYPFTAFDTFVTPPDFFFIFVSGEPFKSMPGHTFETCKDRRLQATAFIRLGSRQFGGF